MLSNDKRFPSWPYFCDDEIEAVTRILRSGRINQWTGEEVVLFEKEYAQYIGIDYAIALANGSVALDLALITLDVGPNDEVIVTPRTFVASASCIALRGAKPIFADVDPNSQNITLESVKKVYSSKTKAIIAVHLAGWPCELDDLRKFCDENKIYLIEDCAQAHGARYNGKQIGSFGHISVFSFCQDKIITTGGEGGLWVTNDKALWEKAWSYKDHGKEYNLVFNKPKKDGFNWVIGSFGTNYRLTEMQAAIGRLQLKKLDSWIDIRRRNAELLTKCFLEIPSLRVTIPSEDIYHSYYKYYVFVRPETLKPSWSRDNIIAAIREYGVPCQMGSCSEVYLEKVFEVSGFRPSIRLSVAKELGETSLMFLVHPTLTESSIGYACDAVKKVMAAASR
jgi:dTDP-4-amino-4,6-dideoxygalactose transaminase